MLSWGNLPFVRILLVFLPAMLLGMFLPASNNLLFALLSLTVAIFVILFLSSKIYTSFYLLAILLLGLLVGVYGQISRPLTNYATQNVLAKGVLIQSVSKKENVFAAEIKIIASSKLFNNQWPGKILCYADTSHTTLLNALIGDTIIFSGKIDDIKTNAYAHLFDYAKHMRNKRIKQQIYVGAKDTLEVVKGSLSIKRIAQIWNNELSEKLNHLKLSEEHKGVMQALLLGNKSELSEHTKKTFANTGIIHVLAVSGLHVGIIFLVLNYFFRSLKYYTIGKVIYLLLMLIGVWLFAFIAGLSPSVTRSAAMFSLLIFGKFLNRESYTFNTICASAFLMLVYNPYLILDVGFQLSYCAVFGILFFYPRIYSWINFGNKLDLVWSLMSVSIAAQLSTLPLTLAYFHQFPTYFFISNLIAIPIITILIYMGVGYLLFYPITAVSGFLGEMLAITLKFLTKVISNIADWPMASIGGLFFNKLTTFLLLACVLLLALFYGLKNKRYQYGFLLCVSSFFVMVAFQTYQKNKQVGAMSIVARHNPSIILYHGNQGLLVLASPASDKDYQYTFEPSFAYLGLSSVDEVVVQKNQFLFWEDKCITREKDKWLIMEN